MPEEVVAGYLRRFYAEARQKNGDIYSKSAYGNIRSAIQRHITSPPYNKTYSIMTSAQFKQANNVFKGQLKANRCSGLDKTQHITAITDNDMTRIKTHLMHNTQTPKGLQDKVLFDILFFFGCRGREGLRDLKRDSFVFKVDGKGRGYACLNYNE